MALDLILPWDLQGLPQPESVSTAIKFVYNYIPLVMCVAVFIMMLLFFNIDRDIEKLKAERNMGI